MATPCGGDPLECIEFLALVVTEFLKDWTTLAMLALLLGLLLRLRADRQRARDEDYARRLGAYADKRGKEGAAQDWTIVKDETGDS